MREIVLDTETTGMDPFSGDRIVEIGCLELINHIPTGKTLHLYINPERDVPAEVVAVHGLTNEFLKDKPVFIEVYDQFLDFIADDKLVIHNAEFDMKFINHHIQEFGVPAIPNRRIVDTLIMARQKFPGSPASLDALCKRFQIDNTARTLHGALLDSELLADVYIELLGGRQTGLSLGQEEASTQSDDQISLSDKKPVRLARQFSIPENELQAHKDLIEKLGDNALWKKVS